MTKFIAIASAALLSVAISATALAQDAQSMRIGVVNLARLLDESPQARSAMGALQEEFAPRQRELVSKQTELKNNQEQLQRDLEVMGPEERRNAERDLRNDERELARRQNEYLEDLNLRRNEELGKLQRELLREVQTYASQADFDLVVGDGVMYASPAMDITSQVLEGLEESFRRQASGQ